MNRMYKIQLPDDVQSAGYKKIGHFEYAQVFKSAAHNFTGTEAGFLTAGLAYKYIQLDKHRRIIIK